MTTQDASESRQPEPAEPQNPPSVSAEQPDFIEQFADPMVRGWDQKGRSKSDIEKEALANLVTGPPRTSGIL